MVFAGFSCNFMVKQVRRQYVGFELLPYLSSDLFPGDIATVGPSKVQYHESVALIRVLCFWLTISV